jgi:GNAT superfamily N-acetyltransferase
MSAYRFCRSDDIGLLVDALNRCWAPYFPDEPPETPATFKRSIRDLQVWCSSCMVAFSGADPIGVIIGAKRPSGTLVHKIAVHPDHRRQGHGRHLLASLGSKLAILGPPRIVAEVPEAFAEASRLFDASGYVQETMLTDYLWEPSGSESSARPDSSTGAGSSGATSRDERAPQSGASRWVIPVTVDDLAANGLLGQVPSSPGQADPQVCWERSVETLTARKEEINGLAVATDERIEAYLLYSRDEIVALRSLVEDGGARVMQLLSQLRAQGLGPFHFPKVHPAEISTEFLETLGFLPAGRQRLYAGRARSE